MRDLTFRVLSVFLNVEEYLAAERLLKCTQDIGKALRCVAVERSGKGMASSPEISSDYKRKEDPRGVVCNWPHLGTVLVCKRVSSTDGQDS